MRFSTPLIRVAVSAVIAWTFVWTFWLSPDSQTVGISEHVSNGVTSFSAGTSPAFIIAGAGMIVLFIGLAKYRVKQSNFRIASMWRRAAAFVVDFWVSVFTIGALFGLVPLVLDASRTGVFHWQIQRDYNVPSDAFSTALVFVGSVAMFCYFLLPLTSGGQTVGGWIFRLVTVDSDGNVARLPLSLATRRLFMELRGVCSPFKSFRERDSIGRTFYDRESGFSVWRY